MHSPEQEANQADLLRRLDQIDRRLDDLLGASPPTIEDGVAETLPTRRRRFTLLDAMILVAFTAFAIPAYRILPSGIEEIDLDSTTGLKRVTLLMFIVWACVTPVAAAWTIAVAMLRQIGPRPGLQALSRQPGAFASSAVTPFLITVVPIHVLIYLSIGTNVDLDDLLFYTMIGTPKLAGGIVAGVWLTLWASGRFNRTPDWVDGLGRALCVYWLIAGTLNISII